MSDKNAQLGKEIQQHTAQFYQYFFQNPFCVDFSARRIEQVKTRESLQGVATQMRGQSTANWDSLEFNEWMVFVSKEVESLRATSSIRGFLKFARELVHKLSEVPDLTAALEPSIHLAYDAPSYWREDMQHWYEQVGEQPILNSLRRSCAQMIAEETSLVQKVDQLVNQNIHFATRFPRYVRRLIARSPTLDDGEVVSIAYDGLVSAAYSWDPENKGFDGYASRWMLSRVKVALKSSERYEKHLVRGVDLDRLPAKEGKDLLYLEIVDKLLDSLNEKQREITKRFYGINCDKLSARKLAEEKGCSYQNIYSRLRKIKELANSKYSHAAKKLIHP